MIKQLYLLLILSYIIFTLVGPVVSAVPKIEPYVNDYANILNQQEEMNLNLICDEIEKNTTYEIAIVTLPNTEGQARLEYGNKIGDENGVGKLDKDNGVVVLYSLENERGGAIATGRGSESIFNDAKVGRIGREAKSLCDEEKYYDCFYFIVTELNKEINVIDNSTNIPVDETQNSLSLITLLIILGLIVIFVVIAATSNGNSSNDSYSGSSSSSSSSSGGSSGGSFGGGSFGGGGASF